MRLRRDLRLHVVQPARKKLSECDLVSLLVGAAGYRGYQAGALNLSFALCASKRMPLGAALAGLRVGNVDDDCPMTRRTFADMAFHYSASSSISSVWLSATFVQTTRACP